MRYILRGEAEKGYSFAKYGYDLTKGISDNELTDGEGWFLTEILGWFAQVNTLFGNHEEAFAYTKMEDRYCQIFYKRHSWSQYHLAVVLYNLGQLEEGEINIRAAIPHYKDINNQQAVIYSCNILALFLARRGEVSKALEYNSNARNRIIYMLGEIHVDSIKALNLRAMIYAIAHDVENACSCWRKAIALFEKADAPRLADVAQSNMQKVINGEEWIFPVIAY